MELFIELYRELHMELSIKLYRDFEEEDRREEERQCPYGLGAGGRARGRVRTLLARLRGSAPMARARTRTGEHESAWCETIPFLPTMSAVPRGAAIPIGLRLVRLGVGRMASRCPLLGARA